MIDLLLHNLRTIGTHHCDGTVGEEAADEIERLRAEVAGLREDAERWRKGAEVWRESAEKFGAEAKTMRPVVDAICAYWDAKRALELLSMGAILEEGDILPEELNLAAAHTKLNAAIDAARKGEA